MNTDVTQNRPAGATARKAQHGVAGATARKAQHGVAGATARQTQDRGADGLGCLAGRTARPGHVSRRAFIAVVGLLGLGLVGCGQVTGDGTSSAGSGGASGDGASTSGASGDNASAGSQGASEAPQEEAPKTSTDPHLEYIKNYKGQNAANVGYAAANGWRMDRLGGGFLRLVLVEPSGVFIDPKDDEQLKGYVVFDQNLAPNTPVDLAFKVDKDGEEYLGMASWQSHSEVVLCVKPVGSADPQPVDMTAIDASPDKRTFYVRDYVGRNLAECGYTAMNSNLMDSYGCGHLQLCPAADDGAFVDPEDQNDLAQYVVTAQNVAPNTKFTLELKTDSNGEEYDMPASQSLQEVTLSLRRLDA